MKEQNFDKNKQQEPFDLEKRLTTFYGPQLREQPLSKASWQNLHSRLGTQEDTIRRHCFSLRFPRKRSRAHVPTSIQDTFTRIAFEARIPTRSSMLRFSLNPHIREPIVRCSRFGKRKIQLILPINAIATIGQSELDVLLATGLARSICTHKPIHVLGRLILIGVMLIACLAMILSWINHLPLVGFSVAIGLCVSAVWIMHLQSRLIAFHADALMVFWFGRVRICSGLHALADHAKTPGRKRWGEPSLAERIKRICGTRVEVTDNQFTLVR
jgi:hypothetical protein